MLCEGVGLADLARLFYSIRDGVRCEFANRTLTRTLNDWPGMLSVPHLDPDAVLDGIQRLGFVLQPSALPWDGPRAKLAVLEHSLLVSGLASISLPLVSTSIVFLFPWACVLSYA